MRTPQRPRRNAGGYILATALAVMRISADEPVELVRHRPARQLPQRRPRGVSRPAAGGARRPGGPRTPTASRGPLQARQQQEPRPPVADTEVKVGGSPPSSRGAGARSGGGWSGGRRNRHLATPAIRLYAAVNGADRKPPPDTSRPAAAILGVTGARVGGFPFGVCLRRRSCWLSSCEGHHRSGAYGPSTGWRPRVHALHPVRVGPAEVRHPSSTPSRPPGSSTRGALTAGRTGAAARREHGAPPGALPRQWRLRGMRCRRAGARAGSVGGHEILNAERPRNCAVVANRTARWRPVGSARLMSVARWGPPAGCSSQIDWPVPTGPVDREEQLKSYEEIMEILEAFDLTGSFRAAAELAGCSQNTVEVLGGAPRRRRAGGAGEPVERRERWSIRSWPRSRSWWNAPTAGSVAMSRSKSSARSVIRRLGPHGCAGRWREAKENYRAGPAPGVSAVDPRAGDVGAVGLGSGTPNVGRRNVSCCAPGWRGRRSPGDDPDVGRDVADGDRLFGSGDARARVRAPTYWLTDNEKTVTVDQWRGSRSGIR